MQQLQALIQGKLPPQAINIDQLIMLAKSIPIRHRLNINY